MNSIATYARATLVAAAALLASQSSALAWGCVAVSSSDSYGYSYDYRTRAAAAKRALYECAKRTPQYDVCEIVECDPDE